MKDKALRSPIAWFGGKGAMVPKLLKLIPPHKLYCEPFAGGASLLFAKEQSPIEVINDLDSGVSSFYSIIRDPEKFSRFYHYAINTPWGRDDYNRCRDTWKECADEIDRAYRWFVVARMSFSGQFGASWGFVVTKESRGMASTCSRWLSILETLPLIHNRLMQVQSEHSDFRPIFERYDTPDSFFYCDPPYVLETRKSGGYDHEMSLEDHRQFSQDRFPDLRICPCNLLPLQGFPSGSGSGNPVPSRACALFSIYSS